MDHPQAQRRQQAVVRYLAGEKIEAIGHDRNCDALRSCCPQNRDQRSGFGRRRWLQQGVGARCRLRERAGCSQCFIACRALFMDRQRFIRSFGELAKHGEPDWHSIRFGVYECDFGERWVFVRRDRKLVGRCDGRRIR